MFRVVFWDILPCKIIVDRRFRSLMEAVRTSETLVDNNFTRQYIPEDNSEHHEYVLNFLHIMSSISIVSFTSYTSVP
jgi:hypothetical protein